MIRQVATLEQPEEIIEHGKHLASDAFDDPVLKDFKTVIDYDGEAVYEKEVSAFRLRVEGVPEVQRTKASPSMRNRIHARRKTWRKYAGNPYKQAAFLREWIRIGFQQEELSQITKLEKKQLAKFLKEHA